MGCGETSVVSPRRSSCNVLPARPPARGTAFSRMRCVVLLIEMELMSSPPDSIGSSLGKESLTLRAWLQRPMRTFSDAADIFGALILSVRHIHRKRIVHADLKPDNIFCAAERTRVTAVRIGDFGLAGENQLFRHRSYGTKGAGGTMLGGTPG